MAEILNNFVADRLREPFWVKRHKQLVRDAQEGEFDVIYLGDSITEGWVGTHTGILMAEYEGNKETWDKMNRSLGVKAANFGMAGDRVLHLLWRMQNGELPSKPPRVLVLCVGVNDLLSWQRADATFANIKRLLSFLTESAPHMRIVLLSVLPTAAGRVFRPQPALLNSKLKTLAGGRISYLDCTAAFLQDVNEIKTDLFQPDSLHLSQEGYRQWALCIQPELKKLLSAPDELPTNKGYRSKSVLSCCFGG